MRKRLEAFSQAIGVVEQAILIGSLGLMIAFAFTQVILRFLPGDWSVTWLEPFARQLVLWVGLLGASFATLERRHISIEAIPKLLNAKQTKWLGVFIGLCAAFLSLILGILAWNWLIGVDRQEISEVHEVAHALRERSDKFASLERPKALAALLDDARKRVDQRRFEGFARKIREDRVTILKLSCLEEDSVLYVAAARKLIKDDERISKASLEQQAAYETANWIAEKFEQAGKAYSDGDVEQAKIFSDKPANADVATAVGDSVSYAVFRLVKELKGDATKDVKTSLEKKAASLIEKVDQKAFLSIGSLVVHEWWFHVIVPVALFIMAFRFLLNAYVAFISTPEEYAALNDHMKKDLEVYEGRESQRLEAAPPIEAPNPPIQAPPPPDPEPVPRAALETVDIPPREGLFEDVDKAPPPRNPSGIIPKQRPAQSEEILTVSEDSSLSELGESSIIGTASETTDTLSTSDSEDKVDTKDTKDEAGEGA